jgi:hypothetical protein
MQTDSLSGCSWVSFCASLTRRSFNPSIIYPHQDSHTVQNSSENVAFHQQRGTESGTVGDDSANNQQGIDADLASVIEAWPSLPADTRKMIAGVVKVTIGKGQRD